MKSPYNYAIIKHNYLYLERESTLTSPKGAKYKYSPNKKYALIVKACHKDGSESIYYIKYSNDLEALQLEAYGFPSWYNYPLDLSMGIQEYISRLNQLPKN